jgi:hypothetical protein
MWYLIILITKFHIDFLLINGHQHLLVQNFTKKWKKKKKKKECFITIFLFFEKKNIIKVLNYYHGLWFEFGNFLKKFHLDKS